MIRSITIVALVACFLQSTPSMAQQGVPGMPGSAPAAAEQEAPALPAITREDFEEEPVLLQEGGSTTSPALPMAQGMIPADPSRTGTMSANEVAQARASTFLTPEERRFSDREGQLIRDIRLVALELELAELQRRRDAERTPSSASAGDSTTRPGAAEATRSANVERPLPFFLVSIWGERGELRADMFVNGRRQTLAAGSDLPDGWRLRAITDNAIEVARGRETRTIDLAAPRRSAP
jgi:type IV pilus biogenesis protein PilP